MKSTHMQLYWKPVVVTMLLIMVGCNQKKPATAVSPTDTDQTAPGDSPIRVAGGSIIVHVKGDWNPGSSNGSFTTASTTKISYTQIKMGGAYTPDPQSPTVPPKSAVWSNLAYWEIDIVDQNPMMMTEGITLCSNPDCKFVANASSEIVLLKPLNGNKSSSFYTTDFTVAGAKFPGKRFYDGLLHGGMDSPANNADIYERIKTVTIKAPSPDGSSTLAYVEDCPEGECFVKIEQTTP